MRFFFWMGTIPLLEQVFQSQEKGETKGSDPSTRRRLVHSQIKFVLESGLRLCFSPCIIWAALLRCQRLCPQVGFLRGGSSCVQQMLNYSVDLTAVSLQLWQANNSVSSSSGEPQRPWWHGRWLCGGSAAKYPSLIKCCLNGRRGTSRLLFVACKAMSPLCQ